MHYQTIFLPNDHFSFQRSFFIQTIFLPNITTHNLINSIKEKTKHKMSKGKNKNNKKVNATDVEKKSNEEKSTEPEPESEAKEEKLPPNPPSSPFPFMAMPPSKPSPHASQYTSHIPHTPHQQTLNQWVTTRSNYHNNFVRKKRLMCLKTAPI